MAEVILVVDDEPSLVNIARLNLEKEGWQVRPAGGAAEAVVILQAEAIDLVLTDFKMPPGQNGLVVVRAAQARGIPCLVLSGSLGELEGKAGDLSGRIRAVEKPPKMGDLLARIRRLLAGEDDPFDL